MARYWNEAILFSIRRDLARPVVHARNLYHLSCAMWDAWSTYETKGTQMFYNIKTDTTGWTQTKIEEHRNISISFAAYVEVVSWTNRCSLSGLTHYRFLYDLVTISSSIATNLSRKRLWI